VGDGRRLGQVFGLVVSQWSQTIEGFVTVGPIAPEGVGTRVGDRRVLSHLCDGGEALTAAAERTLVWELVLQDVSPNDAFIHVPVVAVIPQTFVPKLALK
jgi:hypothetical protein